MTKNTSESYFARSMRRSIEGELRELVDTVRGNIKNNRVMDGSINCDKTKYSNHSLAEVVDGKHENDLILVTRYRIVK